MRYLIPAVAVLATFAADAAAAAPAANFDPTGRWNIELFIDGAALYGPGASASKPMQALISGTGANMTIKITSSGLAYPMIPDGLERETPDGFTRYFYLGPNVWAHAYRSKRRVMFDIDVCVPTADKNTLNCAGQRAEADGKIHQVTGIWRKMSD